MYLKKEKKTKMILTYILKKFINCIIIVCIFFKFEFCYVDTCQNPQGQLGTCISIRSCPALLNLLKSNSQDPQIGNFLRASVCGYQGNDPWVCCPSINGGNTGNNGNNGLEGDRGREITNTPYGPLYPPNCGFSNVTLRRVVGGEPASLGIIDFLIINQLNIYFSIACQITVSTF